MKQIVYNLNDQIFSINFFDVYLVNKEDSYLPIYRIPAPRVIGSNEYFEVLEDAEADWAINNKLKNGFYKNDTDDFCRYYNERIYPEKNLTFNLGQS